MTITDTDYDLLSKEIMREIRQLSYGVVSVAVMGQALNSSPDAMLEAVKILENALCQNLMRKMCNKLKEKAEASIN